MFTDYHTHNMVMIIMINLNIISFIFVIFQMDTIMNLQIMVKFCVIPRLIIKSILIFSDMVIH